jgi:hypothetical protein
MLTSAVATTEADKTRGWLGISVGEVPESLAAQLSTGKGGSIILDIVKDSPADRAGLQTHDIITSVAGQAINAEDGVAGPANLIGAHKPGETINLEVLREGQPRIIRATLGERPDLSMVVWKFNTTPGVQFKDQIKTRAKMLKVDPQGHWQIEDFGDLSKLHNLSDKMKLFIPEHGQRSVKVFANGKSRNVNIEVTNDDGTIRVEQENGEKISVTRTDKNGVESTTEYEDGEALRQADAEAADLLDGTVGSMAIQIGDVDIDVDLDFERNEQLEVSLEKAHEAYGKAMEEFHEAQSRMMEQWHSQGGQPSANAPKFNFMVSPIPAIPHGPISSGKVRQTFEVRPDGSIEVRVRKGDSELINVYSNESDFSRRDPKNYEKYTELNEAEE